MLRRATSIDALDWQENPEFLARAVFGQLANIHEAVPLLPFQFEARTADLPFYRHWKLARIRLTYLPEKDEPPLEDVYCLWRDGRQPLLLEGNAEPIHKVNDDEGLVLEPGTAAAYIRFFFFAVRSEEDPFILFEAPPDQVAAANREAAKDAGPITAAGVDAQGRMLFDTVVVFRGTSFKARLALPTDGQLEMVDDDVLSVTFPMALVDPPPPLGIGPRLNARLAQQLPSPKIKVKTGAPPRRRPRRKAASGASTRPTIVEMVELLLEQALGARSQNRLLGAFNAQLPAATALQRFAALVAGSSPVVIVETKIPFVEETIATIVNDLTPIPDQLVVYRGHVGTDGSGQEVIDQFSLPAAGPGLVLVPLQVYPRVMQVERLAFDITSNDLAAIISCDRFDDLPESLRRHSDLVLTLPALDEPTFEVLFERVMGKRLPARWRSGGTAWVKHLLPTDFEHPRRMQLPRTDAFEFIRGQVTERLVAVDPVQGMSLNQLHGLGEARQFAEDLITDIHAAIAGRLPWSQVDRGALLVGAPGTGKTTLAKAIAKDCGIKFIQASAATWMAQGGSLGPHIMAIRKTFEEARDYAPSILFIDEIDSLGNREKFSSDANSVYQTEVVNAVLEQMQGMDPAAPVFVIGATNHEDSVDPALRRSGRLDRVIQIPRPNSGALDHIFRYHLGRLGAGVARDPGIDTLELGRFSVGLTGADVERIVRGAARRARRESRALTQMDLIDEITHKPRVGTGGSRMTPAELERTATHEAGHAIAMFLSGTRGSDIGYVTIVPRDDGTLGFVAPLPDERVHLTRRDYEEQLEVWLAGRAAEELIYGGDEITSGAGSDLHNATEMVTRMITQLGLGRGRGLLWSDKLSDADLELADRTLTESYERILAKLKANRSKVTKLAKALTARQELPGGEVRGLLQ